MIYIEIGECEVLRTLPRGAGMLKFKSTQAQNRNLKQFKTRAEKALEFENIWAGSPIFEVKRPRKFEDFHCGLKGHYPK